MEVDHDSTKSSKQLCFRQTAHAVNMVPISKSLSVLLLCSSSHLAFSFPTNIGQHGGLFHGPTNLNAVKEKVEYGVDVPYVEASYDSRAAEDFYKDRPIESISRLTQIVTKSSSFIADTVLDAKFNREEEMVDRRSDELLELVSDLGPTFIKVMPKFGYT